MVFGGSELEVRFGDLELVVRVCGGANGYVMAILRKMVMSLRFHVVSRLVSGLRVRKG